MTHSHWSGHCSPSLFERHRSHLGLSPRFAVRSDRHAIVALRCRRRDVTAFEVALDQIERAFPRRPVTTTAAGLDRHPVARLQRIGILFLDALLVRLARLREHEAAGFAFLAALHPPRWILGAVEVGAEQAGPQ